MFIIEPMNLGMWLVVFSACLPNGLTTNRIEPNQETNVKPEYDVRTPNIPR